MFLFVMTALLLCIKTAQSSAVSPVFVESGNDLLLYVSDVPEAFNLFEWKFETQSYTIVKFAQDKKPKVSALYVQRIDISKKYTYSVTLMNLQRIDSGFYIARALIDQYYTLAEYNIIVQDPVSPVQLKVDSVCSSSDSCNVTVSCRTLDADISSTFMCVNETCDQDGGEQSVITNSAASLRVHLVNQTVVCEHSNQVSRTEDETQIGHLCPLKCKPEEVAAGSPGVSQDFSPCKVKTVVISSGLFIMVAAVISVHLIEKFKSRNKHGDWSNRLSHADESCVRSEL